MISLEAFAVLSNLLPSITPKRYGTANRGLHRPERLKFNDFNALNAGGVLNF